MIIVGLSVVVTVIVLQYHHHDPDGGKMPKWVRASLLYTKLCGQKEGFLVPNDGSTKDKGEMRSMPVVVTSFTRPSPTYRYVGCRSYLCHTVTAMAMHILFPEMFCSHFPPAKALKACNESIINSNV